MTLSFAVTISGAVEGPGDEAVLRKLIERCGAALGTTYGKSGKDHLLLQLAGYNSAAHHSPWLVLVDLDQDDMATGCVGSLRSFWLPNPAPLMCFRVVVRAVEAWLLADRPNMARFLGVAAQRVPADPEKMSDPKQALVNVARQSRFRRINEGMVPRQGSGRHVGPLYTACLIDFAQNHWDPDIAAQSSASLQRAMVRLSALVLEQSTGMDAAGPAED